MVSNQSWGLMLQKRGEVAKERGRVVRTVVEGYCKLGVRLCFLEGMPLSKFEIFRMTYFQHAIFCFQNCLGNR